MYRLSRAACTAPARSPSAVLSGRSSASSHRSQELEGFQAAVEVMLELRLEDALDFGKNRRLQLQPPVKGDVSGRHQAQHLQGRDRHQDHARLGALAAEKP